MFNRNVNSCSALLSSAIPAWVCFCDYVCILISVQTTYIPYAFLITFLSQALGFGSDKESKSNWLSTCEHITTFTY